MKNIYLQIFVILVLTSKLLFFEQKEEDKGVAASSVRNQKTVYFHQSEQKFLNPDGLEKKKKPDYRSKIIMKQQEVINQLQSRNSNYRNQRDSYFLLNPKALKNEILTNKHFLDLHQPLKENPVIPPLHRINNIFQPFYSSKKMDDFFREFRREYIKFKQQDQPADSNDVFSLSDLSL